MGFISVPLPNMSGQQDIEIDIKVNDQLKRQNYRVEVFYWKDCKAQYNRAECLREILAKYDKNWQLYYIGMPTEEFVPITFRKINA